MLQSLIYPLVCLAECSIFPRKLIIFVASIREIPHSCWLNLVRSPIFWVASIKKIPHFRGEISESPRNHPSFGAELPIFPRSSRLAAPWTWVLRPGSTWRRARRCLCLGGPVHEYFLGGEKRWLKKAFQCPTILNISEQLEDCLNQPFSVFWVFDSCFLLVHKHHHHGKQLHPPLRFAASPCRSVGAWNSHWSRPWLARWWRVSMWPCIPRRSNGWSYNLWRKEHMLGFVINYYIYIYYI